MTDVKLTGFIFVLRTFRKEGFSASNLNNTSLGRSDYFFEIYMLIMLHIVYA